MRGAEQKPERECPLRDAEAVTLSDHEQAGHGGRTHLRSLLNIHLRLSTIENFDEFCRQAVELCREGLGFDRVGIWFRDVDDPNKLVGSFGTDKKGQTRDERGMVLSVQEIAIDKLTGDGDQYTADYADVIRLLLVGISHVLYPKVRIRTIKTESHPLVAIRVEGMINDLDGNPIREGISSRAVIFGGKEIVGLITMDNLLTQHPVTDEDCELLAMYGAADQAVCRNK